MEQNNVNPILPSIIYSCDQCQKTYRHKQSLRRHVERIHIVSSVRVLRVANLQLNQKIFHLNREIEIYKGIYTYV